MLTSIKTTNFKYTNVGKGYVAFFINKQTYIVLKKNIDFTNIDTIFKKISDESNKLIENERVQPVFMSNKSIDDYKTYGYYQNDTKLLEYNKDFKKDKFKDYTLVLRSVETGTLFDVNGKKYLSARSITVPTQYVDIKQVEAVTKKDKTLKFRKISNTVVVLSKVVKTKAEYDKLTDDKMYKLFDVVIPS